MAQILNGNVACGCQRSLSHGLKSRTLDPNAALTQPRAHRDAASVDMLQASTPAPTGQNTQKQET